MNGFSAWLKDKWLNFWADLRRFYKSWTVLFGLAAELVIEYLPEITQAATDMESYMLPETYKRIMQGIVMVNIALRFKTTKAMRHK
jgi:hypothetical protein